MIKGTRNSSIGTFHSNPSYIKGKMRNRKKKLFITERICSNTFILIKFIATFWNSGFQLLRSNVIKMSAKFHLWAHKHTHQDENFLNVASSVKLFKKRKQNNYPFLSFRRQQHCYNWHLKIKKPVKRKEEMKKQN